MSTNMTKRWLSGVLTVISLYGCAKYEVVGGKKPAEQIGDGKPFIGNIGCQPLASGDDIVCRSSDGRIDLRAHPRQTFVGQPVNFTGICDQKPVIRWSFGDNTSAQTSNPVHRYAKAGTYTVFGDCVLSNQQAVRGSLIITIVQASGSGSGPNPSQNSGANPSQN